MSQRELKSTGTCPVCWSVLKLQREDGTLRKLGSGDHPCPGSGTISAGSHSSHPVTGSASGATHSSQQQRDSSAARTDSVSLQQPINDSNTVDFSLPDDVIPSASKAVSLHHRPWVMLIERITKAARQAYATLLNQLLHKIICNPSDVAACIIFFRSVQQFSPSRNEAEPAGISQMSSLKKLRDGTTPEFERKKTIKRNTVSK